ncbi:MAG: class B sortase [Clostridia bacterium]|nr:class B sortase [Clostridia bacterium]
MANTPDIFSHSQDDDELDVNSIVDEFRTASPEDKGVTIVQPLSTGSADALASLPHRPSHATSSPEAEAAQSISTTPEEPDEQTPPKRALAARIFGAIVPHIGDSAFDVIRKCVMIVGILVFVGAVTYLVDDLVLIPMQNTVLAQSLQNDYNPDAEPVLDENEQNFPYPAGIDPSFKKLYYQNSDIRGWLSFHSDDGATINMEYPVMQAKDNDFYLYHDYHLTYNKNGSLFFDYRNDFSNQNYFNHNAIIYGHNMASGQMFAGLNRLLDGVDVARTARTFTMNTLYRKGEYKVFALIVVNNNSAEGQPFNYLRTEFSDNVDFAYFLSEILARSLYVYGDVDLQPTDEIVMLSTCSEYGDVYFNDGRTVLVARRVRDGESPNTDPSQITVNDDVLMPYAWYTHQGITPHAYYLDPNYVIQPIDSLLQYMSTSVVASNSTTTTFPFYQGNGTFGLIASQTTTMTGTTTATGVFTMPPAYTVNPLYTSPTQPTSPYLTRIYIGNSTKTRYQLYEDFSRAQTHVFGVYSNGAVQQLSDWVASGFYSYSPGYRTVYVYYQNLRISFNVYVEPPVATTVPTLPEPTTVPTLPEPTTIVTDAEPTTTIPQSEE